MSALRELRLPLLVIAAQLVVLSTGGADHFKDDAYISLQYAANLVAGQGLVFNPGELVEGFTNPLWTLIGALVLALGLPPVGTLKVLGAMCAVGLVISAWRALADADASPFARVAGPTLAAACVALPYWALSGMETVAYAWAVLEGTRRFALALRDGRARSLSGAAAFGVATLLRPEALALFGLAAAVNLLFRMPRGVPEWRAAAIAGAVYAAPVGAWQCVRLGYYGAWLPNTFYAKVGGGDRVLQRGLDYLAASSLETPILGLALGAAIGWVLLRRADRPTSDALLWCTLPAFHLAYVVRVGGDYMDIGRFIVPALPLLVVAWALATDRAPRVRLATGLLALGLGLTPYAFKSVASEPDPQLARYLVAGGWIGEHAPADALVATPAVGAVGYLGQRRVLDMLGIIDPVIARWRDPTVQLVGAAAGHDRAHPAYVLERRPDIVLLANIWVRGERLTPESLTRNQHLLYATDRFLLGDPAFLGQGYDVVNWPLPHGRWLGAAVRRDSAMHPAHASYTGPAGAELIGPPPANERDSDH